MQLCCDIHKHCRDKTTRQLANICRNKDKAECKMTIRRLSRHFTTPSRHKMRRAPKEALEFCRNMEMNIPTKLRNEGKKNVATPDNYVGTKNRANDRKTLSRHLKLCHDQG